MSKNRRHQRHQQEGEADFGSDSFLDVISNMVGILIILILMAAFRAKRAPVTADELIAAAAKSSPIADVEHPHVSPQVPDAAQSIAPNPNSDEPLLALPDEQPQQPDANSSDASRIAAIEAEKQVLSARAAQYQRLVSKLEKELDITDDSDIRSKLANARTQQQSAEEDLRQLKLSLQQRQLAQTQVRASLDDEQREIELLRQQLDQINKQLKVVAAREQRKEKLQHKVTPLGLTVYGREIYFRVLRGRISTVPLDELSKLVGEKIHQNASWIVKSNRHQGEVGPIDGYVMKYEVVRASSGLVDDLNQGYGMIKLEVPRFTVEPITSLRDETVKESLQPDGLFVRQLAQSSPDTTVTIWVYPDSFVEYRQLAAFAQQNGFVVAARPLPLGLPITGSSSGTRSIGQ